LFRQFAVENVFLCLSGGAIGLIFARVLLHTLVGQIPLQLPTSTTVRLDLPVLVFAFVIALLTGLIFTAAPLVATMRGDIFTTLRAAGQVTGLGAGGQRIRGALLVAQVAFSVTLLISAALLIQSLNHLNREALGFVPEGVITFSTPAEPARHASAAETRLFQQAVLQKIAALSGVRKVAIVNVLPLKDKNNFPTERVGHPDQSIGGMEIRLVSPQYFAAMAIPILRGRSLSGTDINGAAPVILINARLARTWWANEDPLGDQIKVGWYQGHDIGDDPVRQVVGVVGDTKDLYLTAAPRPTVYVPLDQGQWNEWGFSWVVRAGEVKGLEQQIRQAVAAIDPHQRITNLQTMDEIVDSTKATSRFDAWLFGIFAGLALLLTAVGLYGLLSFSVARRTNEIGTRLALGARRTEVIEMVLWQGLKLVGMGLVLGSVGALILTRSLSSLLFGVHPANPVSYLAVVILLLSVSLLAGYFPARRAAGLDPMAALRSE
jgi:predicted permease